MRPLDTLERWLRPVAMPYLAPVLAGAQVLVFMWIMVSASHDPSRVLDPIRLVPEEVLAGEWWRLLTFLAVPPTLHPLWAILSWLVFVTIGLQLERHWGVARFNLFLLIGWVATSAAAFAVPSQPSTNGFLMLSVFLAFATLAPETIFRIYFVLPVKVKWLALISWILLGIAFVGGDGATRIAVLASVTNWAVFFLPTVLRRARDQGSRAIRPRVAKVAEPFHRCSVCGRTDVSDPTLEFRYTPQLEGPPRCLCIEHLPRTTS